MSTASAPTTHTITTIVRDGRPPLRFQGHRIGYGSNRYSGGYEQNRWTTTRIYRTKGGRIVVERIHSTIWQGESDYTDAESFATARETIQWLKQEETSLLTDVSQQALATAADADPEFSAAYVEDVD